MYTPIQLDKTRNLRFGMRANKLIEKTLNIKSVTRLFKEDEEISTEEIATIIWAGLAHEDATLTPDDVIDLIDDHSSFTKIMPIVMQAFAEAFTDGVENNSKNVVKATKKNSQ